MRGEIDCSYITTILTASSSTSWMVWMVRLWVVAKLQVISWYIEPGLSSVATQHHSALCPTGHNLNISIKKFQENKWLVLSNKGLYRTLWSERSSNTSFSSHRTARSYKEKLVDPHISHCWWWWLGRGCRLPLSVLAKIDLSKPTCCIKLLFVFIPRPVIGKMAGRSGTHHHLSTDNTFSGKIFSTS